MAGFYDDYDENTTEYDLEETDDLPEDDEDFDEDDDIEEDDGYPEDDLENPYVEEENQEEEEDPLEDKEDKKKKKKKKGQEESEEEIKVSQKNPLKGGNSDRKTMNSIAKNYDCRGLRPKMLCPICKQDSVYPEPITNWRRFTHWQTQYVCLNQKCKISFPEHSQKRLVKNADGLRLRESRLNWFF